MKLSMRIIAALATLQGHPIRFSTVAAPEKDPDSIAIEVNPDPQIGRARNLRSTKGIGYAGKLKLDLLIPQGSGPRPLVLYLPGGGFVAARRMMAAKQRQYLAAAGYVVASIDYRTTTVGATYRDGLTDVAAALEFLRSHATEYGIDPDRVAVWGESAGGYLASMAGTEPGNRITAVVDFFGASDLASIAEGFEGEIVAALTGPGAAIPAYVLGPDRAAADHPDEMRQADPATRVTADTPPFLLLHGDDDRVIPPMQTARLHQALREAGVDSTRYVVTGGGHGDLSDNPELWTSKQLMDLVVDFLRTQLGH
ncbi:alpha/beta hydrolase [Kribbella kalugense]|uniref:Acetyl esterase/lipase n=1 Tax=Kribbella kalugense TaxID=2512221 RepID=A0A4R7ZV02_9ACTN|nr:alpha/beta hydrolase [Kribbella kalugense]TDW21917.1 acetyl esterase/lipase [Kribbella kalugense]